MKKIKLINGINSLKTDFFQLAQREIDFYNVSPKVGTLYLTYRCNSRCQTCSIWKRPQEEEKKKEIGLKEWKNIIDKLVHAGVRNFEIFGGNVLLRKELLISLLQYIKKQDCIIHLPTNQIGLDDELIAAMVENLDYIYVSTDGIGEKQDEIRGGEGSSIRLEGAIARMLAFKKGKRYPRLICNTTVSRFNFDILDQIVEYAIQMKFDEIHFEYAGEFSPESIDRSLIDGLKPAPFYIKSGESILVDGQGAQVVKQKIREIKQKYKNCRDIDIVTINIDGRSMESLYTGLIPHDKCYCERIETTVDPYGNLVACPFINNYVYGNLSNNSFDAVWNNKKHKIFRRHQNNGQIDMCKNCILGVQRNPGILKSMERIYHYRIAPKITT